MNVAIATGGTGGHISPALALADVLRARGDTVTFLIDARAARTHASAFADAHVIAGAGFAGRGARVAVAAAGISRGILQARVVLRRARACALVAFGGYMSVAPVLAARVLGLRIVLHEQNAVMGRANRLLARVAGIVAISFAGTRGARAGAVLTGNPVGAAFMAAPYVTDNGVARIFVIGGSLGARAFAAVPAMLANAGSPMRVTQQCRAEDLDAVRAAYTASNIEAEVATSYTDVARRMAEARLVISRAGASSVAEIAAAGRPSLLVPLPNAIDDHQTANARVLVDAGAALLLRQDELGEPGTADVVRALLADPSRLSAMASACAAVAWPDAAERLADLVRA